MENDVCDWCGHDEPKSAHGDFHVVEVFGIKHKICGDCLDKLEPLYPDAKDLDDGTPVVTIPMQHDDWNTLIDALQAIKPNPRCGDVAGKLIEMFELARNGKYYYLELYHEDQNGECYVSGMDYEGVEQRAG